MRAKLLKDRKKEAVSFSVPDYFFECFDQITPSFLHDIGVRALLCDIDNTLVTYDDPLPTPAVIAWLEAMQQAGIAIMFLSNNNAARVQQFCEGTALLSCAHAHKPLPGKAKKLLKQIGIHKKESAILGDQIFTDVWTGRFLGVKATILVPPIKDKKTFFFRLKRWLEKPFLAAYRRRTRRIEKEKQRRT